MGARHRVGGGYVRLRGLSSAPDAPAVALGGPATAGSFDVTDLPFYECSYDLHVHSYSSSRE